MKKIKESPYYIHHKVTRGDVARVMGRCRGTTAYLKKRFGFALK
jgi:hypothetical protein